MHALLPRFLLHHCSIFGKVTEVDLGPDINRENSLQGVPQPWCIIAFNMKSIHSSIYEDRRSDLGDHWWSGLQ